VNDGVTAELMELFYAGFRGGAGAAAALNSAMASVRTRRPHPYYWAPFFLLGCPSAAQVRADAAGGGGGVPEGTMP
jgi:CHAT domain-containing protein